MPGTRELWNNKNRLLYSEESGGARTTEGMEKGVNTYIIAEHREKCSGGYYLNGAIFVPDGLCMRAASPTGPI